MYVARIHAALNPDLTESSNACWVLLEIMLALAVGALAQDCDWDVELYGKLLSVGGGKERMTAHWNGKRLSR